MKTLYMRLTPRPDSPSEKSGITWFTSASFNAGPEKTLRLVQRAADKRGLGIDYSLISFLEYASMRAARAWLISEPGDKAADLQFKVLLVRAGMFLDTSDILGFICNGVDDYTIQVITAEDCTTINTKASTIEVQKHKLPEHPCEMSQAEYDLNDKEGITV